jgi:hypothetical protein
MEFTVSGSRITLTADQVQQAARRLGAEPIRSHVVQIDGALYPVKRVFAEASGLDLLDFTTNQARRVLKTLGFELKRVQ